MQRPEGPVKVTTVLVTVTVEFATAAEVMETAALAVAISTAVMVTSAAMAPAAMATAAMATAAMAPAAMAAVTAMKAAVIWQENSVKVQAGK
jgi:hypothetical protein